MHCSEMGDEERDQSERLHDGNGGESRDNRLNRKSGPVLVALIYNDNMDIASYYLARGKLEGLDKGDSFGWTALIHASFFGYLDIVEELLATGADKDKALNSGDIPLTVAAGRGHIEVLKALLAAVADKTKADESGETALSLATTNKHTEVMSLLQ